MARAERSRTARELLGDIVRWGERLAAHVAGMTAEEFSRDTKTQDAVRKCLEVIGEASRNLMVADPGIETRHPGLELTRAYRARNRLPHGYDSVDYDVGWVAAQRDVPPMVAAARALLRSGP
jgi:uncharacterized protein with HEPN domain